MWMIYTQHQESKPTTLMVFSPYKCPIIAERLRPTAHSSGLSRDNAKALATTFPDSNSQEPTGRTMEERPSISTSVISQC